MKRVFCIAIMLGLLVFSGCKPDYTRRAWVYHSPLNGQFIVDEIGNSWDLPNEYALGTELELGIREGGILTTESDDKIVSVTVIHSPETWEYELEVWVSYVNPISRTVEATDSYENVWSFMYYSDGFSIGDRIILVMDNMDTEAVFDDVVIDVIR